MNFGIIVSDFNSDITGAMLQGAVKGFEEQGHSVDIVHVPGAVEIPVALQHYIQSRRPQAVVTLGCIIKGDTEHYEAVCRMCADGIMRVMLDTKIPVVFEVLMVDDLEKARVRIEKGYEAAFTAVRMAQTVKTVS